jgi:hypothetical protein
MKFGAVRQELNLHLHPKGWYSYRELIGFPLNYHGISNCGRIGVCNLITFIFLHHNMSHSGSYMSHSGRMKTVLSANSLTGQRMRFIRRRKSKTSMFWGKEIGKTILGKIEIIDFQSRLRIPSHGKLSPWSESYRSPFPLSPRITCNNPSLITSKGGGCAVPAFEERAHCLELCHSISVCHSLSIKNLMEILI